MKSKLINFPSINFPSLEKSQARRDYLQFQLNKYGLTKSNCLLTNPYEEIKHNYVIHGEYLEHGSLGVNISFLTLIRDWYNKGEEEYAIFCDDDVDLSTIDYWSFTWEEFVSNLPNNWECVQLIKENDWYEDTYWKYNVYETPSLKLKPRSWDDWGSFLMINRNYAKKIIERHWVGPNEINMYIHDECWGVMFPIIENILYRNYGTTVYTFPLFLESMQFLDCSVNLQNALETDLPRYHNAIRYRTNSRNYYKTLWEETGLSLNIKNMLKLEDLS